MASSNTIRGYRHLSANSTSHFSGNQLVGEVDGPDERLAQVWRDSTIEYGAHYYGSYVGDVYTHDRWSLNAGLRLDVQRARNLPSTAPANASFPDLLPALSYPGDPSDIVRWSDVSPRVGLSYALDEARKTVLRASYARYVNQLFSFNVLNENPTAASQLAYGWIDDNGDGFVQPGEVRHPLFVFGGW